MSQHRHGFTCIATLWKNMAKAPRNGNVSFIKQQSNERGLQLVHTETSKRTKSEEVCVGVGWGGVGGAEACWLALPLLARLPRTKKDKREANSKQEERRRNIQKSRCKGERKRKWGTLGYRERGSRALLISLPLESFRSFSLCWLPPPNAVFMPSCLFPTLFFLFIFVLLQKYAYSTSPGRST